MPTILHLSDIHRTSDEFVSNSEILHGLEADLDSHPGATIPQIDLVLISGDLTQSAEPTEYVEAKQFLTELLKHLKLPLERLVLVPGNHDVHWPTSEEAFCLRRAKPPKLPDHLAIAIHGEFLCAGSEEAYQKRLEHFRAFYLDLFGRPYPLKREEQFEIKRYSDLKVAFALFNSCDLNDHRRFQGRIHVDAIRPAAEQLTGFDGVCVAAWHHDLNWRGASTSDFLDPDSLRHLSLRTFDLGLCGHTHRPANHNAHRIGGIDLPVVSAGSLCAGPRQRPDAVPRAYNVVALNNSGARVHVRSRDSRSEPWAGRATCIQEDGTYLPYFDVTYARRTGIRSPPGSASAVPSGGSSGADPSLSALAPRSPAEVRAPTPFGELNAKTMARQDVVTQYIWTVTADTLDTSSPQIVLGPRGAGKTALLMSLGIEGRLANPRLRDAAPLLLSRVGLLCPMNIADVTAFNGKGWIPRDERCRLFGVLLATLWASELVGTVETCIQSSRTSLTAASERQISDSLAKAWFDGKTELTFAAIRDRLKATRSLMVRVLGTHAPSERRKLLRQLYKHPISSGGVSPLNDLAGELRGLTEFSSTRWVVLFDEVEFLNEWQQDIVYKLLGQSMDRVSVKIATLPYAHNRSLRSMKPRLVEGNDFRQLPLSLAAELESPGDDGTSSSFIAIAEGVWRTRLERAGLKYMPLETIWPEREFDDVLRDCAEIGCERKDLEKELISFLSSGMRARAAELQQSDRSAFLDQYWRRYQQPFRFRSTARRSKARVACGLPALPLYWGWRTLLRAADYNCRWFLRLADECWRLYWSNDGLRPLTAQEQDTAVRSWAAVVYRVSGVVTEHGDELRRILDEVAQPLRRRVYVEPTLREEASRVEVQRLSPQQAEAVAVGIAYGYLTPRLADGTVDGSQGYPTKDVELRLGYAVAVAKELPLRAGATLHIRDLRQVTFPWLKD